MFSDGHCDDECNNAACGWDGLDCLDDASKDAGVIPGTFQIVLTISRSRFGRQQQKRFERYLSIVLRTNLRIKRDLNGHPMISEVRSFTLKRHKLLKLYFKGVCL